MNVFKIRPGVLAAVTLLTLTAPSQAATEIRRLSPTRSGAPFIAQWTRYSKRNSRS